MSASTSRKTDRKRRLLSITRALRERLTWEAKYNAAHIGVAPAPDDERREFEERESARQKQRLDRQLAAIRGDTGGGAARTPEAPPRSSAAPASSAPASTDATPAATPSKTPGQPASQPPSKTPASRPNEETSEATGEAANPASSASSQLASGASASKESARTTSDDQPAIWKTFGSRPRPTVAAESEENSEGASPEEGGEGPGAEKTGGEKDNGSMSNADKLAFLRDYLGDCHRCPLHQGRTNIVFGDGNPEARIVFVGEGPGYHEDQQGVPFVGKAGALLDRMIVAMGFEREDVYICNVVKCRPPNNRDPRPEEVGACSPFLFKQIDAIQPDIIITLGRFAANTLLGKDEAMGRLRARWHDFRGIPLLPIYHPAYLLRNESAKSKTWQALQMAMDRLAED